MEESSQTWFVSELLLFGCVTPGNTLNLPRPQILNVKLVVWWGVVVYAKELVFRACRFSLELELFWSYAFPCDSVLLSVSGGDYYPEFYQHSLAFKNECFCKQCIFSFAYLGSAKMVSYMVSNNLFVSLGFFLTGSLVRESGLFLILDQRMG